MQKNNGNSRLSTGRVFRSITSAAAAVAVAVTTVAGVFPAMPANAQAAGRDEAEVVLRVCNWEEYIDLGDWDEEETIERRRSSWNPAISSAKIPWSRTSRNGTKRTTA